MSYSKRQFVTAAFEEIGLASYVFDLQPEQLDSAVQKLDSLMAAWNAAGIRLSYPIPGNPDNTDIDAITNVPDSANEAIVMSLAVRLAPGLGKAVSIDTKVSAKQGYNTLLSRAAVPPQMQFPSNMPAGAGNKPWSIDDPFLVDPVDALLAGPDGDIQFT